MGLSTGAVPARVDAPVKKALLDLVDDAVGAGFSLRQACTWLRIPHTRVLGWQAKAAAGDSLQDRPSGPAEAAHGLLDWEREAIIDLARDWEQVDLTHRKLAHRGSRLEAVYVSESSVLRVLEAAGMRLPGLPRPEPRSRRAFPDWAELTPGVIYCYDFTHFSGLPGWCAIAVIDVVSRYCLSLRLCAEETSTQVEAAFIEALSTDGKAWLLEDEAFAAELAAGHVPDPDLGAVLGQEVDADPEGLGLPPEATVPVLLAVSDNGPQMTSSNTAKFMAAARIGQHFGRPGTPNDQAWIESFFGHLKTENPHLEELTDPGALAAELENRKEHYNTIRLHEGIGYVTPEDEHYGRGEAIRQARKKGLARAHQNRVATRRAARQNRTTPTTMDAD
ncbi:integrase core domain-containing protein [Nesterenkonia alkaliphila]|uniref:integrase core domain-containing protein n=1 Tax=Nesterenkonia alkaliphila TaxID=1463631 RepID=UPI00166CC1FE|nr:integrase core domain-containing protein [Nesterenkonia alkaliphila]GGA00698.1 hypothetical protein GCM10011359_31380 [Nesterenkonia alkaliphila]